MITIREEVLTIPANIINKTISLTNGYTDYNINDLKNCLSNSANIYDIWKDKTIYVSKEDAECNITVYQLIPYIIVKNEFNEYFTLEKTNRFYTDYNKPKNYKNKRSLGINNHIYKTECGHNDPIFECAMQIVLNDYQIKEITNTLKFKGFVIDYAEKKCIHLGMVFILNNLKNNIPKQNKEYYKSKWMSKNELIDKYGQFDQWSKYIIDYLVDDEL